MIASRLLFVLLFFFAWPASAQPDVVDTKQGLTYQKPSGWTIAAAKKGTVGALVKAGDEKSQIEFRFAKIEPDRAANYFATFHTSLVKAKLERVGEPNEQTHGKLTGKMTEYKTGKGASQKALFVFEFTTSKGAWLAVGMFDARNRDADLKNFETLLSSCTPE